MSTSLEDILNGSGPAKHANPEPQAAEIIQPAPPEPEEDTASQEAIQAATGDTELGAPSAAPPAARQEEPLDKRISAFQQKAEDETRKRQDYERQLQERNARLEAAEKAIMERDAYIQKMAKAQPHAAADEIDIYDPQQLQQLIAGMINQHVQPLQRGTLESKVVTSQEFMRSRVEDYEEVESIFAEEMLLRESQGDPSLRRRMEADPFPAKFAYDTGKKIKAMREIGDDPASYEQRIIEKYLASQAAQQQPAAPPVQTQAKPVPQPPKSLAGVPSAARNVNKQSWKGPTPLDQLLS